MNKHFHLKIRGLDIWEVFFFFAHQYSYSSWWFCREYLHTESKYFKVEIWFFRTILLNFRAANQSCCRKKMSHHNSWEWRTCGLLVCHHPVIYDKGDLGWATSIAEWDLLTGTWGCYFHLSSRQVHQTVLIKVILHHKTWELIYCCLD